MQNAMMVFLETIVVKSATAVMVIHVPRRMVNVLLCARLAGMAPTVRMVCRPLSCIYPLIPSMLFG